jgi:hypothetical protein
VDPGFLDEFSRHPESWNPSIAVQILGWSAVVAIVAVLQVARVLPRQVAAGALIGLGVVQILETLRLILLEGDRFRMAGMYAAQVAVGVGSGLLSLLAGIIAITVVTSNGRLGIGRAPTGKHRV